MQPPIPDTPRLSVLLAAARRDPDGPAVTAPDMTVSRAALAGAVLPEGPGLVPVDSGTAADRLAAALGAMAAGRIAVMAPLPGVPDAGLAARARQGGLALPLAGRVALWRIEGAMRAGAALAARLGLTPADRVSAPPDPVAPAFWIAALAALAAGAPLSLIPDDPQATVAILPAAPPAARGALRAVVWPGAAAEVRALRVRLRGVAILNALSAPGTLGAIVTSDPRDPARTVPRTRGRPLPGAEAMIVDPTTGKDLALYERGEVWLRGAGVMAGFLDRAGGAGLRLEPDGFLRTGLIGHLDSEGRIVLTQGAS